MRASRLSRATLLFSLALLSAGPDARARPNVVIFLADDMGWGDLSCHGSDFLRTPNIDLLASEGMDFQQFYVASPVCSTSRAAFLTGNHPSRFRLQTALAGTDSNMDADQVDWLDPEAVLLPKLFQQAGYRTGLMGKWHLSAADAMDAPHLHAYGWDEYRVFRGQFGNIIGHRAVWEQAEQFIQRNAADPFFLLVSFHESHLAHYPTDANLAANAHLGEREQIYAAIIREADFGVGRVLEALRSEGLEDDTLVLFSSDHGPAAPNPVKFTTKEGYGARYSLGSTGGRRGRKASLMDGGVIAPLLVKWPGRTPSGIIDKTTVLSAVDILPTVCAAADIDLPQGYRSDGENALAAWEGAEFARTKPMFWAYPARDPTKSDYWASWAVRSGDWKLLAATNLYRCELYNIAEDPGESVDLSAEEPAKANELKTLLEEWIGHLPVFPPSAATSSFRPASAPTAPISHQELVEIEAKEVEFLGQPFTDYGLEYSTDGAVWIPVQEGLVGTGVPERARLEEWTPTGTYRVVSRTVDAERVTLKIERAGGTMILMANSESGKTYQFRRSRNLLSWNSLAEVEGTGSLLSLAVPYRGGSAYFDAHALEEDLILQRARLGPLPGGGPPALWTNAKDGFTYRIEFSRNLTDWAFRDRFLGSDGEVGIPVQYDGPRGFFRIGRELSPTVEEAVAVTGGAGEPSELEFMTQPGQRYEIYASADSTSWQRVAGVDGTGEALTVARPFGEGPFYRVTQIVTGGEIALSTLKTVVVGRHLRITFEGDPARTYNLQRTELGITTTIRRGIPGDAEVVIVDDPRPGATYEIVP